MFKKYQFNRKIVISLIVVLICALLILLVNSSNYLLASSIFAFASTLPFYYRYESRKPEVREFIVVMVMCSLAVVSRLVFAFLPGIKPMFAIIIITGATFGKQAGFMTGSLSAILSNIFFAQGPWSVYQMLINGLMGYFAGIFNKNKLMDNNKLFRYFYGVIWGILFSVLIDLLTTISSGYTTEKLVTLLIASLPFIIYYSISNLLFLYFLYDPLTKKLKRVKIKYNME